MKKNNVPRLRFPGFEGEWKGRKLKELITGIDSGWSPYCEESVAKLDEWGVLKTTSVVWEGFNDTENKKLPNHLSPRLEMEVLPNDILITRAGPTNRVGVPVHVDSVRPRLMLSDKIIRVRSNGENDSRFLTLLLKQSEVQKQIVSKSSGLATSQTNISQSILLNVDLVSPTLPEQQKIASFLTAVDEKLQALKKKKSLLEQYKKGVMQKIFSQELRFRDENGKEFPDWEQKELKEVSTEIKRKLNELVDTDELEVLTISSNSGFISQKERFSQIIAGDSLSKYTILTKGELSYNRGASKKFQYGCIFALKDYEKALVPNIYISFAFKKSCNSEFFDQLFSTGFANQQLRGFISSSVRLDGLLNINREDFFSISIPVPTHSEQTKIANFLSAIDEKINHCSKQIEKTAEWKKGLLQQMFV